MKIVVIHGPNLNMLGRRDKAVYGSRTLDEINGHIISRGNVIGVDVECFQSNCEGAIIDKIQQCGADGIIINAGAYSHYSYAIADALRDSQAGKVEVHLSNIYARDEFRKTSVISETCEAVISGLGAYGYLVALDHLKSKMHVPADNIRSNMSALDSVVSKLNKK